MKPRARPGGAPQVVLLCSMAASIAHADPPVEPATVAPLDQIIVTGSRIPVPANLTATSPTTVISSQEILLEGKTDITDVINLLPQNVIANGIDFGNNSNPLSVPGGIATADLRGLGPQRTLVLVNGRRLGTGDPNTGNPNPAPDLDQIPAALVERVDVVTGGASAVYGSDAVAGVVNFIMKRDFQGVQIDGQYGFNQHHNQDRNVEGLESAAGLTPPSGSFRAGDRHDFTLVMGNNLADGTGNISGYFVYHNQSPEPGKLLDFADCLLITNATNTGYNCDDSQNSNQFGLVGSQSKYSVVGSQFLPYPQAGSVPAPTFNSADYEYQQRHDVRYQAGLFAHLDLNRWVKPYLEFSFMNDRTDETVAPSGLFEGLNPVDPLGGGGYAINCNNPLLSAQELGVIQSQGACPGTGGVAGENVNLTIGRRNIEGGGREYAWEHVNYRVVGGVGGNLLDGVTYDAYGSYYYTTLYNANTNFLNYASINNALQVTGIAANPVCASGPPCVPFNIFTQGGVTPAALAYLYTPGTAYGTNSENILHADITADLGKYNVSSPWAKDGPGLNLGVEHREETLQFAPDGAELAGDLAGFGGASVAIHNGYGVTEGFGELRIPIAQNLPFAKDLSFDAGDRYSDYTTAGGVSTYKFEVQYAPVQDVRFRYSWDRAIRAPNLIELYNPQSFGGIASVTSDPCAPTKVGGVLTRAVQSLANCMRSGVTAAEYGNGLDTSTLAQCVASQCSQELGGNPHLHPETADTWSLGLSLTPTFIPNLTGSIDYYHIVIKNEIGSIPASSILSGCLNNTSPAYCNYVVRTAGGDLSGASLQTGGYIVQTSVNTASAFVSGIDVNLSYRYPLDRWGSLSTSFVGTWVQHNEATPYAGAVTYDCAGLFGITCQGINPTWRHNFRVTWDTPWKLLVSAQWRFIGHSDFDNNSPNAYLQNDEEGGYDSVNARIPSYSYLDLSAVYQVYRGISVRAGVTNALDKEPPVIPSDVTGTGSANTYTNYDVVGRQIFMGFNAKF